VWVVILCVWMGRGVVVGAGWGGEVVLAQQFVKRYLVASLASLLKQKLEQNSEAVSKRYLGGGPLRERARVGRA
jgi:hypothetical protein